MNLTYIFISSRFHDPVSFKPSFKAIKIHYKFTLIKKLSWSNERIQVKTLAKLAKTRIMKKCC
jgi:hypothetical protein